MAAPGHTRQNPSTTSITTASSTGQYDDYLQVPGQGYDYTSDASSYAYSSPGDSPAGDISPDQSFGEGGAGVRRSLSASSVGTGRRARHVSQACDSCKVKKTKCDGANPCSVCEKNGWKCITTSKDNRKTPNKAYVASLEREATNLRQRNDVHQRQLAAMRQKVLAYEEKLKSAGLSADGTGGSGMSVTTGTGGTTVEGPRLSIQIPQARRREGSGEGEGAELLGMGEKLVRDRSGSLTAYAGPSPLAHLATSPAPGPPSSPPVPDPQAPKLGWSSIAVAPEIQVQAVRNFFGLSGTELLPVAEQTLHLLEYGLAPTTPPATPGQPLELTPAFYNALMANALQFLPPHAGILRSNVEHFASAAQDIGGIFGHQGMGNVLGLGLLAQWCAGAGEFDVGWQYAGMSARMMQSLGLHLDFTRRERDIAWASLSPMEKKLRNLVYWIVYIQDKLWYLWVGRATAVQDNEEVPLPEAEGETHEASLVFRAYCQLMRIAGRIMPSVYGAERSEELAVIDAHRLALDSWLNSQPDLLKPTPKAMETASLSLRHLHMVYHWLRILLDRPFYRQITQQLAQETGVMRTDASLRAIMNLLGPWDSKIARAGPMQTHIPVPLPLTPQLAQIVLTTGITWLHSAVAFHKFSKKRKDEGVEKARICLRLLHEGGHRAFSAMLRRLMRKYFSSIEISEPGVRGLNASMTGLGINTGPSGAILPPGGIAVPMLPQVQMSPPADSDNFSPDAQTIFSQEPAPFEPGNTNMSLAMGTLTAFPPDLLSPPHYSPNSASPMASGLHTPINGYAQLQPNGQLAPWNNGGPDTQMIEIMSEYLQNYSSEDGVQGEAGPSSAGNDGLMTGFVPDWVQQQQEQRQQQQQPQIQNPYGVYQQEPEDYAMDQSASGEMMDGANNANDAFRGRYSQKTIVPQPGVTRGVSPGNLGWPGMNA
ncbi:hypothetical protein CALVIDRAFT_564356 [Calocera viscosa TUFC12733]|uniref:Zn(2)-C6 fungal-type domain-containing protein n=1 Tax=Calocera viscosa (strain TUFC12733) TaxID=1330018 RepID=A0A167LW35_CALVF|nr:hypothetical protein CALVIDRAFT_564356 [Calocera viscosa TUFC12733]